jgi:hypothetical protein
MKNCQAIVFSSGSGAHGSNPRTSGLVADTALSFFPRLSASKQVGAASLQGIIHANLQRGQFDCNEAAWLTTR